MLHSKQIIAYAVGLQDAHRHELGFLPKTTFERYLQQHKLRLQYLNDEPCGFLTHGQPRTNDCVKIYQACIQTDARRIKEATELVHGLIADCRRVQAASLVCRCAADLDATAFWKALGFRPVALELPASRTGRQLIRYELRLSPSLFDALTAAESEIDLSRRNTPAINFVPRWPTPRKT